MGSGGLKATEMNLRLQVYVPTQVLHNGCLLLLRDGSMQRSYYINPKNIRNPCQ